MDSFAKYQAEYAQKKLRVIAAAILVVKLS